MKDLRIVYCFNTIIPKYLKKAFFAAQEAFASLFQESPPKNSFGIPASSSQKSRHQPLEIFSTTKASFLRLKNSSSDILSLLGGKKAFLCINLPFFNRKRFTTPHPCSSQLYLCSWLKYFDTKKRI